jgi:Cd2+/Zn2+-exporting ATPase
MTDPQDVQAGLPQWRFKIEGLDCQNEVRTLRDTVGPLIGEGTNLAFDTADGFMTVGPVGSIDIAAIEQAVASTGMRAHLTPELASRSADGPWLFQIEGLDCANEVAKLKREIGSLVGGDTFLFFDTTQGRMTVARQARATVDDILDRLMSAGLRGTILGDPMVAALLFRIPELQARDQVAALTRELAPLVGEGALAFDTETGALTVLPNGADRAAIATAIGNTGLQASSKSEPSQATPSPALHAQPSEVCGCEPSGAEALSPPVKTHIVGGMVFRIHGMDCADEIAALKREVGPIVGEEALSFDLLNGRMAIGRAPDIELEARIEKAVQRAGLRAEPWIEGSTSDASVADDRRRRLQTWLTSASGVFSALGFAAHAWLGGGIVAAFEAGEAAAGSTPLISKILYTLAILAAVRYVAPKAWLSARRLRPDMNLLMMIAVAGAIGIGAWFEAATVSFFFALALALEAWSLGRARRAVAALMELAPLTARVRHEDGSEHDVPAGEVAMGAHLVIRPGEKVPLDGIITAGESEVNQAPITGESVPVAKTIGAEVFAGTINGEGVLDVLTTKAANDTTLAQIIRMVGSAQSRRAPSEQWVEKFARIYTPVVMALAIAVFLVPPLVFGSGWETWFYRALVLLVIACPCALVISTPVTIVAALAGAAKQGVLIKGGTHLETPARLQAIAMDKTGTLTRGEPQVVEFLPFDGHSVAELLGLAAALEARSEHPIARAILAEATEQALIFVPADEVRAIMGRGVTGLVDGRDAWLGSRRFLDERTGGAPAALDHADRLASAGRTIVAVGLDDKVHGLIAVSDTVRPEAKSIVTALRRAGVKHVVMLTGDNLATAQAIAMQTGIDEVKAELLPGDKVGAVEDLVRRFGSVAMVGDGVNDAPAMGRANLGIAMGAMGSDAAIETADIALMSDDLSKLPWLIRHSRATLAVVRQNVGFSLAVKLLFLALTLIGVASLWGAIAADVGASLLVVLNGLRLLHRGQGPTLRISPTGLLKPA